MSRKPPATLILKIVSLAWFNLFLTMQTYTTGLTSLSREKQPGSQRDPKAKRVWEFHISLTTLYDIIVISYRTVGLISGNTEYELSKT